MKCPTCGAENDPANRFCDQCGTKLDAATTSAPVMAAAPAATAATPTTCPNCGASVLPGEAFCDECGQPLSAAPVVTETSSADAPTIAAPAVATGETTPAEASVVCAACGHHNLPGDKFCENCGAELATAQAPAATPAAEMTAPPLAANDQSLPVENVPAADQHFQDQTNGTPVAPTAEEALAEAADEAAPVPAADEAVPVPAADEVAPAPTDDQVVTAAPQAEATPAEAAPAQPDANAERQRLTDEIARQDMVIAQFEQMATMFGENTPPAVKDGLVQAREARAQAEAALNALPAAAPAVDPAEVARLNEEIARQDQIIAQFEQMATMFGANTPPAVTDGLTQAREARQKASDELQALTGGSASTAAPVAVPAETSAVPTAVDTASAESAPTPAPAVAPAAGPRLLIEEGGAEIPLAQDKAELIIGREDPISGIFPEIDLTPYGGESGGVSRQHAKLVNTGGQWALVDLNSTNYTRVDGNKLDPQVPTPVKDGSRLQLGRVVMTFKQ